MAFDPGQRGSLVSQINVTPLVDVMLVLLIIFMVTAPILQQGVEVKPAQGQGRGPARRRATVRGLDHSDDGIYLNDTRLDAAELTRKLQAIAAERPDRQVFIRADEAVPYGEVIRTMAAIKAAGIENVGMVTQMPAESAAPPLSERKSGHKQSSG